jgi:hypothetical protein
VAPSRFPTPIQWAKGIKPPKPLSPSRYSTVAVCLSSVTRGRTSRLRGRKISSSTSASPPTGSTGLKAHRIHNETRADGNLSDSDKMEVGEGEELRRSPTESTGSLASNVSISMMDQGVTDAV